jgi:RNA polymerase sigma-70 factor (ECF subfamily)
MDELVARLPLVSTESDLERELADRLRDSSRLAFRVAYGVLRNRDDAEDVAQEAFVRAHAQLATLRDREAFRAWLVRITWRLAIDRQRADGRRRRRDQRAFESVSPAFSAEELAAQRQRQERLWEAVDALPEALRSVVILAAIEGYDTRETATLLELPEGTVKSRLFTARKRLAESLRCLVSNTNRR